MTDSEHSETLIDQRRGSLQISVTWLMLAVCCYLVPFGLLWLDEAILKSYLFDRSLRALGPHVADQIREFVRFIYWPLLEGMRQLKILPT